MKKNNFFLFKWEKIMLEIGQSGRPGLGKAAGELRKNASADLGLS